VTILRAITLILTLVTGGLVAGLFAAFSYAVMPALDRTGPSTAIVAMQRINVVIVNPVFLAIFIGGLVFAIAGTVLTWRDDLRWWVLAAAVLYVVAFLVTGMANVPLNDRLAHAGTIEPVAAQQVWSEYVVPWVRWNTLRAVLHTASVAVLAAGLVLTRG
jgi:uncharacterized membrane protein